MSCKYRNTVQEMSSPVGLELCYGEQEGRARKRKTLNHRSSTSWALLQTNGVGMDGWHGQGGVEWELVAIKTG